MSSNSTTDRTLLRAALARGNACVPIERLEVLTEGPAATRSKLEQHVRSCAHCQTELELLKTFYEGGAVDSGDVRTMTATLRERSKEIFRPQLDHTPRKHRWWRLVRIAWPSALAAAAIPLVAAVVVAYRQASLQPVLNETPSSGREVFRSSSFAVISPNGDVSAQPTEIRWERVHSAAKYQIRLSEVDGAEVWKAETPDDHVALPSFVLSRTVPAKTFFCEVTAYDSFGGKVGETGSVRFRWLLNANRQ